MSPAHSCHNLLSSCRYRIPSGGGTVNAAMPTTEHLDRAPLLWDEYEALPDVMAFDNTNETLHLTATPHLDIGPMTVTFAPNDLQA